MHTKKKRRRRKAVGRSAAAFLPRTFGFFWLSRCWPLCLCFWLIKLWEMFFLLARCGDECVLCFVKFAFRLLKRSDELLNPMTYSSVFLAQLTRHCIVLMRKPGQVPTVVNNWMLVVFLAKWREGWDEAVGQVMSEVLSSFLSLFFFFLV